MKAARCPICKKELATRSKNFPFCSARCKLVDAGNWFEGNYRIEPTEGEPGDESEGSQRRWGEN